ncbi:ABC transporter permease [Paenibacillus endoradicis]|uniref:ABC transporter permease n=1 Tax=Paenibacillus endoradicis TaxID=2972487 RepID=UPI002158DD5B|nr:ABC transporter permease [Paenibacillus endoradicis]MCR8656793.1 ABC transporter permease [Paenibacillus endoradicis]
MRKYIIKRILISLLTIWLLATVSFFLLRSLPGNPFQTEVLLSEEAQQRMIEYYGYNEPLHQQYLKYMGNLLQGDLGYSLKYVNRSVNSIISDSFPVSAELGLRALAIALPIGLLLGVIAARRRGKAADYLCVFVAVIGISVPSFIVGTLLQYSFSVKLNWFPVAQWKGLEYTILPSIAMGLGLLATLTRLMRASMLEVTTQDYIKTAKAKGLNERQIVWRHQLRNSMLPIVTVLGPLVANVLMGTFVVEQIFAIPGLGLHFVQSVQSLDYTMALGLTVFFGAFLVTANFIVDLVYGFIDPRIRVAD